MTMVRKFIILLSLALAFLAPHALWDDACADDRAGAEISNPPPPLANHSISNSAPMEGFKRALKLFGSGDYEGAAAAALETAKDYPRTPWEGRSIFLAGRAYAAQDDLDAAAVVFGNARKKYPVLADYSLYILAGAYSKASRHEESAQAYHALVADYPDSPLVKNSLIGAARANVELKRYTDAIADLKRSLDMKVSSWQAAEARYLLMEAYAGLDNLVAAYGQYRTLWLDYPDNPWAGKAEKLVMELAKSGLVLPEPSGEDYLQRAGRLFEHGEFKAALDGYVNALRVLPEGGSAAVGTLLKIGICHYRLKDNADAVAYFRGVLNYPQPSGDAPEALYWLTRTCLRTEDDASLREYALACASRYPNHPRAVDCLYYLGVSFTNDGDFDTAAEMFKEILTGYPGSKKTDETLWQLGRAYFNERDYEEACAAFKRLTVGYPESELAAQGLYWQAKSLDALGRKDEANTAYGKLVKDYSLSFYGLLTGSSPGPSVRGGTRKPDPPPAQPLAEYSDPALARAVELGLQDMKASGVSELKGAEKKYRADLESVKGLSGLYYFLGEYQRPLELALNLYGGALATGRGPVPEDALRMAYPLGYWDTVRAGASDFEVDPLLVLALIREESRFDPDAVSSAGAVGLMQLMPGTAKTICRKLGVGYAGSEQLKDGGFNIPIGTCHIKALLERRGGRLAYALAEYNAGPEALERWVNKNPDAPDDEFIEGITYQETRNYVKRVLRNYGMYKMLYGP